MANNQYSLKFLIEADARSAKRAFEETTADANRFSNTMSSAFGTAIPIVGALASGIAVAGAGLLTLAKTAAEFGSEIYDASQKTGLSATALSAMKAAADQSGASLEAVTKGVAKFAKQYKGDSGDLQAELGKVFKQIADAKPGFEQLTLAQKNFGKGGADLIPFIRSFDGDVNKLIKTMAELGITIDDKAAYEADQFGDQMDILDAQLAGVGRTIGTAVMPQLTAMAGEFSDFLKNNKSAIENWGTVTGNILRGITMSWDDAAAAMRRYMGGRSDTENRSGMSLSGDQLMSALFPVWAVGSYLNDKGGSSKQGTWVLPDPKKQGTDTDTPGGTKASKAVKKPFRPSSQAQAILDAANQLGISALDLATIIGFETAGTYSPKKTNQYGYKGLIQFGASEQKQYGVSSGQSFETQVTTSVVKFLKDRFASVGRSTAGASLLDLYRTILGGNPNASLTRTDANGTSPLSGVRKMLREHRPKALARFFGGEEANAKGGEWGKDYAGFANEAEKDLADRKKAEDDFMQYAEDVLQDWIGAERTAMNERLDLRKGEANLAEEILRGQLDQGLISEQEYTDRVGQLRIDMLQDERDELADQISTRENIHKLAMLDLDIAAAKLQKENDIAAALKRQREEWDKMQGGLRKANQRPGGMKTRTAGGGGFFDDLDDMTGKVRTMSDVLGGLGNMAGDIFMQMGQGLGQMLSAWVMMGDQADISMSKMVASVLAGVAAQAATLSIFHLAMGIVALTPWGAAMYGPATNHFIAAAMWGGIAAGAAIGGRALAGSSGKSAGSSSGSGSGSYAGSTGSASAANTSPLSRASSTAFYSGRDMTTDRLAASIDRLEQKITGMRPGDVLTVGAREKRGFIGETVAKEIKSNASIGRDILRTAGAR